MYEGSIRFALANAGEGKTYRYFQLSRRYPGWLCANPLIEANVSARARIADPAATNSERAGQLGTARSRVAETMPVV